LFVFAVADDDFLVFNFFFDCITRSCNKSIIEFGDFFVDVKEIIAAIDDEDCGFLILLASLLLPSLSFDFTNSEKISDVSLVCGSKSGKECEIPCEGGREIVIRPGGTLSDRLKLYVSASHPGVNFDVYKLFEKDV
jgi:hypothetical protein